MDWGIIISMALGFIAGAYVEYFSAYKKGFRDGELYGWDQATRRAYDR